MTLLLLEALGAGLIFIAIIWWTMFSGRKNGELHRTPDAATDTTHPVAESRPAQGKNLNE
jgi:hypothetical protein